MKKVDFPLKYLKDLLKDAKAYIDYAYIDEKGVMKGRPNEGGLGEYIVFPKHREKIMDYAPLVFDIAELQDGLKNLNSKTVSCTWTDSALYISDDGENGPTVVDIPVKGFKYPRFVEHVWSKLFTYNFKKISDENMELLKGGNIAEIDSFYRTDEDPIQIILSGKDFRISKSLKAIYTAAVDKETTYQEKCKHNHVVTWIEYDTCDIYMLCGVV